MRSSSVHTPTLLLDLTPLDTPTRHRGNGRYLRELACGLAQLPAASLGNLRLLGLTHLGLDGSYRITDDLTSFQGSPGIISPTSRDHYRWAYARRIALWRAVRSIGVAAIHLGDPNATPLLMGLTSCRKIVTCHDTIPLHYPSRYLGYKDGGPWVGRAIERRRYRSADRVIAISEATRRDCIDLLGVPAERVVRVYNGVDVDRWSAEPALSTASVLTHYELGTRPFVLYVGGADWHKNIDGMIAGLAHAHARGAELDLAWAGSLRPSQRDRITALAQRAGVRASVHLLGYVSDAHLAVLYRAAVAHVLLSRCEGFGLTVVEAMASGCAVLTTAAGSLAEVAGDSALLVEPDQHAAIGEALARLTHDPLLRTQLGRQGQQRAQRFSHTAQAQAMVRVYRDSIRG